MSKFRLPENQMKAVLSDLANGRTVREVSRKYGIAPNTLYRWRAKLPNGHLPDDKERLQFLEAENRRLKKEFAELTLDYATLRAALIRDAMGDC
ncbi:MAG: hypothetical protein CV089_05600 [Nitrospira sp. WS110]|nr:hypothetical protein [Nitrospira sp. WS110]